MGHSMKTPIVGTDYVSSSLTILRTGEDKSFNSGMFKNLTQFKQLPDVIVTPRKSPELSNVSQKQLG